MKSKYFDMGCVVCTHTIDGEMKNNPFFAAEISIAVNRYANMDWGNVECNDIMKNDVSLLNPDDVFVVGRYATSKGKIFIITNRKSEIPRDNSTTIMFSNEY